MRGQDAFDIIKLCMTTLKQRKAHEPDDCPGGTSSGSLECHGAFHKQGVLRHAAPIVETHNLDPQCDLAVGGARQTVRPSPEHSSIFGEVHHSAGPGVVAGRIDVKGETAEGQEPWLRAEELFSMIFIIILPQ
ncbi:hypothetical protein TcYC6_0002930 [Trypanosoma cruzi]|nr:hypothetical protein TcYC6_0002930 [Trypanosoma cruzi]